jgi:hypothetical protein
MKKLMLTAFVALVGLANVGCQHIAGVCDCSNPESSAATAHTANPYAVAGGEKK